VKEMRACVLKPKMTKELPLQRFNLLLKPSYLQGLHDLVRTLSIDTEQEQSSRTAHAKPNMPSCAQSPSDSFTPLFSLLARSLASSFHLTCSLQQQPSHFILAYLQILKITFRCCLVSSQPFLSCLASFQHH
jgi:hypothetical protein